MNYTEALLETLAQYHELARAEAKRMDGGYSSTARKLDGLYRDIRKRYIAQIESLKEGVTYGQSA